MENPGKTETCWGDYVSQLGGGEKSQPPVTRHRKSGTKCTDAYLEYLKDSGEDLQLLLPMDVQVLHI